MSFSMIASSEALTSSLIDSGLSVCISNTHYSGTVLWKLLKQLKDTPQPGGERQSPWCLPPYHLSPSC